MPGPDPDALWIERHSDRYTVSYQSYLWTGNSGNRRKRAEAMLRRLIRGAWKCGWCGETLPEWRRADVQYCRESCRKKSARARRAWRGASF